MTNPGTTATAAVQASEPRRPAVPRRLSPGEGRPPTGPGPRRLRRHLVLVGLAVALLAVALGVGSQLRGDRAQPGSWGGFDNGRIPAERLCAVPGQPDHRLRCDAAGAYGRMATAYRTRFKAKLCITDSYRPYDQQVAAREAKPGLAAKPGTSNHGWGLAVDLCGGVNSFSSSRHRWVVANGPTYGWRHPSWAKEGKPQAEPWHFEFGKL